jgi:hypothetical protein
MSRLYIKTISRDDNHHTFAFTSAIEGAWYWNTEEQPTRFFRVIGDWGGISVKSPIEFGKSGLCTDFRVESRPQGGFAVSCEHPFPLDS